jgi:hypothetical protein
LTRGNNKRIGVKAGTGPVTCGASRINQNAFSFFLTIKLTGSISLPPISLGCQEAAERLKTLILADKHFEALTPNVAEAALDVRFE